MVTPIVSSTMGLGIPIVRPDGPDHAASMAMRRSLAPIMIAARFVTSPQAVEFVHLPGIYRNHATIANCDMPQKRHQSRRP
jgi:hypothetical protein